MTLAKRDRQCYSTCDSIVGDSFLP